MLKWGRSVNGNTPACHVGDSEFNPRVPRHTPQYKNKKDAHS